MSFYKEVPGLEKTLESTLKFDTEPTAGSTNPVTSDGVKTAIDGAVGNVAENLQQQIDGIAEKAGSGYIPKGEASVATLNALSDQENGDLYTMTDAGTLTDGTLAVVAGDTVAWDATNSVWYKAMDYAPAQYGTNEVHNLQTSITAFRTGDVIPVDGPSGTAKMSADKIYYSGNVETLGVTALSSITKVGTYAVPLSYMPNITDLPAYSASASAFLQVEKTNGVPSFIQKITFSDGAGVSFWRVLSGGVAQSWKIVSTEVFNINTYKKNISSYTLSEAIAEVPAHSRRLGLIITFRQAVGDERAYIYTAVDTEDVHWNNTANWQELLLASRIGNDVQAMGVTALSTITKVGFYQVPLAYMSSLNDLPSDAPNVSASMIVERANPAAVIQTITFTDLQSWSRIVSGGTAQSWYKNFSPSVGSRTRFIAMGDSITEGYWADDDGTLKPPTSLNWPYYVSIINNWSVTNAGAGGSGYVHNGTVAPKTKNAVGMVNDVDFSNYDIVSFAWGVNDWHYKCNIGDISTSTLNDGTMVGNMRYCVEKVLTDNPKCKIVVVLPFNSSAFGGDFDSNWGLGTSLPTSGTLQNVIDKIKSVCEYYGLQMIDSVNNSVVNRFNIEDYFPDGLHPAKDGYLQIARCYAKQMMFG